MDQENKKISYKYNILKLLSLFTLLISVTCCWFIFTKDAKVDSIKLNVITSLQVTISNSSKDKWGNKLNLNNQNKVPLSDISGNGEKFYTANAEKFQVTSYSLIKESLKYGYDDRRYIEAVTYIRTDGPICLYLSPESEIVPNNNTKLKDNIAGAIRVAILVKNYDPFIWVPNTTYEYDPVTNTVNKEGTPESSFMYAYKETDDEFITTNDLVVIDNSALDPVGVSRNKRFVWGNLKEIEDYKNAVDPIFRTDKELTELTEIEMVIRIWIEGTDREAVSQLVGGQIKLNLGFLAVDNK